MTSWLLSQAEPSSWLDYADKLGLLGAAVIAVWAFATRRIITRGDYEEMREDRDRWRTLALRGINMGEQAVNIVKERLP